MTVTEVLRADAAGLESGELGGAPGLEVPRWSTAAVAPLPLPAQRADLEAHWMAILPALVEALPLLGIEERDILLTGHPLTVSLGGWASVQPCLSSGASVAVVRASSPSRTAIVVDLNGAPGEVIADILDCIQALLLRRRRRLDADRAAKEEEIREMVEVTGWTCTGVGGTEIATGFRDADDCVCGRMTRSEHRRGDPASDRFSISLEVTALSFAAALEALAALRRGLVPVVPGRLPDAPTSPAVVLAG